jgi:hypothetical protein
MLITDEERELLRSRIIGERVQGFMSFMHREARIFGREAVMADILRAVKNTDTHVDIDVIGELLKLLVAIETEVDSPLLHIADAACSPDNIVTKILMSQKCDNFIGMSSDATLELMLATEVREIEQRRKLFLVCTTCNIERCKDPHRRAHLLVSYGFGRGGKHGYMMIADVARVRLDAISLRRKAYFHCRKYAIVDSMKTISQEIEDYRSFINKEITI